MLLYTMANRSPPWKSDNLSALQIMMKVAAKQERPPIPDDTPPNIVSLIKQCWQHDPNARPKASDIITALKSGKLVVVPIPQACDEKTALTSVTSVANTSVTTNMNTNTNTNTNTTTSTNTNTSSSSSTNSNSTNTNTNININSSGGSSSKTPNGADSISSTGSPTPTTKVCKFDIECYRKNPQHFTEESHPKRDGYTDLLEKILNDPPISIANRDALTNYRKKYNMSHEQHVRLIEKYGWSEEEFVRGRLSKKKKKDKKRKRSD
eukprot:TRINITY_DN2353_c0_g1_i8.p1 TRINITY_DN2353_c0_g1~~TRINITY_DN2353_c0_g1_i8.p1  ORF type:complete len:265 (-),score=56.85 TRINITY_DN2353_c0_g1_i8:156-950(-)